MWCSWKARRCFYVAVPSAWDDRESVKWHYDERYLERERERKIESVSYTHLDVYKRQDLTIYYYSLLLFSILTSLIRSQSPAQLITSTWVPQFISLIIRLMYANYGLPQHDPIASTSVLTNLSASENVLSTWRFYQ